MECDDSSSLWSRGFSESGHPAERLLVFGKGFSRCPHIGQWKKLQVAEWEATKCGGSF